MCPYVRPYMCALICVSLYVCPYVRPYMCALICAPLYVCSYMCALISTGFEDALRLDELLAHYKGDVAAAFAGVFFSFSFSLSIFFSGLQG